MAVGSVRVCGGAGGDGSDAGGEKPESEYSERTTDGLGSANSRPACASYFLRLPKALGYQLNQHAFINSLLRLPSFTQQTFQCLSSSRTCMY